MGKGQITLNVVQYENLKLDYEEKLKAQKTRIFELVEENEKLINQMKKYERKEKEITKALLSASEKAKEIEENAKKKYDFEMSRIRSFGDKISSFYDKIIEKYPIDKDIENIKKFVKSLCEIAKKNECENYNINVKDENVINRIKQMTIAEELALTSNLNPKQRIEKFVAKETNGFRLEDVLNPKVELNLEELCKDLGII